MELTGKTIQPNPYRDGVIVCVSLASLALAGYSVSPKVGVIRALMLRWRSNIWPLSVNHVNSVRADKIHEINHALTSKTNCIIVTGAPGMGTSSVVNTVLHRRPGVIRLSVRNTFLIHLL